MGGLVAGTLAVAAEQATGRGRRGLVLAAAPLAAALGAEAMREGGNAFDGAVTAALVETVLLPPKCGLAGDLVAIVSGPEPEALVAVGGAADGLADAVAVHGLEVTGPRSVGVPGAPAGYAALAARGKLPLSRLAAPAVGLAREGFVWAQICTALARESLDVVRRHNPGGNRYFPGWAPIEPGAVVRLPGLADLLERFVDEGEGLFAGPVGKTVAAYVAERGGVLTPDDFRHGRAEWTAPVAGPAGPGRLWATPAPTHGPLLVMAMAEATPEDDQGRVWDRVVAALEGGTRLADGGTSMVSAADDDGNVVVVIHSNSFPRFGSGLVVPELDLILSNRPGRGFTAEPGHPNGPAPGRRPATTLHAWAFERGDRRTYGGTPGGVNQMPWNAQLLSQAVAGVDDPGMLVVSPRWEWAGGRAVIEGGFDAEEERAVVSRAEGADWIPRWGLRSAQQVVVAPRPGEAIVGAVDPRTGGMAVPV